MVQQVAPEGPIALAGFVWRRHQPRPRRLAGQRQVAQAVLGTAAAARWPRAARSHLRTLVLHGELDDTVPLPAVLTGRGPRYCLSVVPGGGHFFHGQLTLLKNLVVRHLQSGR